MSAHTPEHGRYDAIIVGAGVGGLYAIHRLRKLGLSVRAFEAGDGVGGAATSCGVCWVVSVGGAG